MRRCRLYARDLAVVEKEVLDRAALTQFCAAVDGSPQEDVVQEQTARREGVGLTIDRWRRTGQGERANIDGETAHWRAVGGDDLLAQTPAGEAGNTTLMHEMGRHGHVTRKRGMVDEEDPIASTGEQQAQRAASTSRAHNNRIVQGSLLSSSARLLELCLPGHPGTSGAS